ncbi:MAG: winged helix-turn-helix domain-containing protein [Pseudolabrys sp.]|nr:winged helix-turn-helix domain-containing protein [Pseudolabrys sp.]
MIFRFAGFELDPQRAELRGVDGAPIKLRPKTFEMLRLLAANAGRVLSKQELMEALWPKVHVSEDSLFQCIREIRTALGDERRQTVKLATGGGYLFTADVSVMADDRPRTGEATPPNAAVLTDPPPPAENEPVPAPLPKFHLGRRRWAAMAAAGLLCGIIGLAFAAPMLRPSAVFKATPPVVAVMPIVDASGDPRGTAMAREVTDRLSDGFAKIDNIRVVAPRPVAGSAEAVSAPSASPDFEMRGELQRGEGAWTLRARMIRTATGEVQSVATASVGVDESDTQLLQTRLAARAGSRLARHLNEILEIGKASVAQGAPLGDAKVAIEQAVASIKQTSRERFGMAQAMLKKALADDPNNIDIAVALAALQLRGIQMVWFSPEEAIAAEAQAKATLERALRAKPNSIAVLESYCRFLSATNQFVDSLVTCARILDFDPWNGGALYLIGLGQINLGRMEDALATFQQADRFDTPAVSRWTWLLGVGYAKLLLGHPQEAVPWLERSIAITAASGRSHMLLAAAYEQSGRMEQARAAMQQGLKLRPGTTLLNVSPPTKNASPTFLRAAEPILQAMVAAGLPPQ